MRMIKLCIRAYTTYLKCVFEYRAALITGMFSNFTSYVVMYVGIWILLDRFIMIQGWTLYEVLLLFNLNLVSYALAGFIFDLPMLGMENMIRRGVFDIVLVRPMNTLLYTIVGKPMPLYFAHWTLGAIVFMMCFANLNIQWTFIKVVFLLFTIIGAALIQSAMQLIAGTLCFWIVRSRSVSGVLVHGSREFVQYPISIYGKFIQVLLTFVIPWAFVNFYPAQYFLDKKGDALFHPILQFGTPVVGVVHFLLANKFWTIGVNRYESTGS